ncbi:sugar phosphate isomerase/epimerase [Spirosoma sp. BT702]|uniref:Sugar phosphate isomerase/epimerase n=1 Tax=Spirosoma profusum TaxID=2771354 RepID=A0A927AQD7_9BACT|nr:sugar phosphate isomerase/epimerase family protein [Spirosoma profusum]MBD2700213.1 sugar phosphate isomerase/epimerase [Spirosoma profusum]
MSFSRRSFLTTSALAAVSPALPSVNSLAQPAPTSAGRIKLGLSSYSYWHFKKTKVPIETVIDEAARLGFEGVDILHRQMEGEDNAYLQKLKRHAFLNGIDLICLSIHQGFVFPDAAERQKNIEHTIKGIEMAYKLGIPSMRLNTGRWNTIKSFDELMTKRGIEPILPGHTEDEGFKWVIDSIEKCLPKAAECGVMLALENHWGLSSTPEGLLRIRKAIDSPWMGVLMDTGNFLENPYEKLEQVAPYASFVQAKTYYGGGEWYSLDLDYKRIFDILKKANYKGYVSLEFEGKEAAESGVRQSLELMRKAMA